MRKMQRKNVPNDDEIREYQDVVRINYSDLDGVWCVMDGLKLLIEKPYDELMQNAFYNGWLHEHFVGCLFVFVPSGKIVSYRLNAPGMWNDTNIA
jgi:hypothetical protein